MRNTLKRTCFILLGLMGFKTSNALAEQDIYLCIDGIVGEVSTKSDTGCIDILAWSWGTSNSGKAGGSGGGSFVQDISLTKMQDVTSTRLMRTVMDGKLLPSFELRVRQSCGVPDCEGPIVYSLAVPASSKLTSVSLGGSGGESRSIENISINMPSATWCNSPRDGNGEPIGQLVCDSWTFIDLP